MAVPFVDLRAIHDPIRATMLDALTRVVDSDRYILGPEVEAFEREVAAFLDVPHAIGVSSGTDALLVAMMALDIGPGDEVITTPYTFFATAGAIARLGAKPVFCDIEPESYQIDPARAAGVITDRTRAIMVVHLFGGTADMTALGALSADRGIPLIEDAAQAIGAEWQGRRVGGIGRAGCFSFFPAKNLGALGDGGLVTCRDAELAARVARLRKHGGEQRYLHREIGGNFRLDAIQAAVLRVKLPELEGWTRQRQDNAVRYRELFGARGLEDVVTPPPHGEGRHVWNQYVIRVHGGRRTELFEGLRAVDVGCAVYYPTPLHLQPCFRSLGHRVGDLPEAERAADEGLALPIAPGLTESHQEEVVEAIAKVLRGP